MNEWMNDEAVYRTASATPGLLTICTISVVWQEDNHPWLCHSSGKLYIHVLVILKPLTSLPEIYLCLITLLKRSNLKTLQAKINIVKNTCACFREKSKIVSLSTFDQREFKKNIISTKMCLGSEKGHFLPFLAPSTNLCQFYFLFFFIHIDQKYSMKQFEIPLKHAHVFLPILILDCKVFKLERFSSLTWNVSVKHPILKVN